MLKKLLLIVYMGAFSFCFAQSSNYSLLFNGTTDYVAMTNDNILNVGKVTIEFWMYWEETVGTDVDFVIGKAVEQLEVHTGGGSGDHGLRFIPTSHLFYDTNPSAFVSNTWTHVAFTYDPNSTPKCTCYINGILVSVTKRGDGTEGSSIITSTNELRIGKRGDGSYPFKGKIDEMRIWNVIRNQTQIQTYKDVELAGNEEGLVAYYKMNEGAGTALSDCKTTSPKLDGTITGATFQTGFPISELPVELCSFSANYRSSKVNLNWETATEINNYGFEIERCNQAGNNFESIGFVNGNGNSNTPKSYCFTDSNVSDGLYQYRLKQIDVNGNFEYSKVVEVCINSTPTVYELMQNYPNPFNPATTIKFSIPTNQYVTLKVYDLLGKEVATLFDENLNAGTYQKEFNASHLSSGMYLYKLKAGNFNQTKKLLLIK